jgi:hypothetical protein
MTSPMSKRLMAHRPLTIGNGTRATAIPWKFAPNDYSIQNLADLCLPFCSE